jgi:hypothetical protein
MGIWDGSETYRDVAEQPCKIPDRELSRASISCKPTSVPQGDRLINLLSTASGIGEVAISASNCGGLNGAGGIHIPLAMVFHADPLSDDSMQTRYTWLFNLPALLSPAVFTLAH